MALAGPVGGPGPVFNVKYGPEVGGEILVHWRCEMIEAKHETNEYRSRWRFNFITED